jgi:putative ABC transport system substrate-binding protein
MNRRKALAVLLASLTGPRAAVAQQPGRSYRLGVLFSGGSLSMEPYRDAVRERLATYGFIEGRNLQTTWRGSASERVSDRKTAGELVAANPDAILAFSAAMAQAVQFATRTIPIVFTQVSDPIADGVVKDYAHPGGNVTGVSTYHRELLGKRMELLRELLPKAKRVALITPYATDPSFAAARPTLQEAAKRLDFELEELMQANLWQAEKTRPDAMFVYSVLGEVFTMDNLVRLAEKLRIGSIFPDAEWVQRGGLVSYGTDPLQDARLAADQLAKILAGAKAGEQPVIQNSQFVLAVNLGTAKALGVPVPRSLQMRADVVV